MAAPMQRARAWCLLLAAGLLVRAAGKLRGSHIGAAKVRTQLPLMEPETLLRWIESLLDMVTMMPRLAMRWPAIVRDWIPARPYGPSGMTYRLGAARRPG